MIRVIVYQGREDKMAQSISDDLISSLSMAETRALQELAAHRSVFRDRSLEIPHDPTLNVGDLKEVVVSYLGIYGTNEIMSSSVTIDEGGLVSHQVETRQLGGLTP